MHTLPDSFWEKRMAPHSISTHVMKKIKFVAILVNKPHNTELQMMDWIYKLYATTLNVMLLRNMLLFKKVLVYSTWVNKYMKIFAHLAR